MRSLEIKSDDASDLLIQYLTQLGIKLFGYEKEINGIDKKPSERLIGERQQPVQEHAKFTSRMQAMIYSLSVNSQLCIWLHGMLKVDQRYPSFEIDVTLKAKERTQRNIIMKSSS